MSKIPTGYKQTEVGVIPEEWEVERLDQCSTKITDGEHATPRRAKSGYFLLSARNIQHGRIDINDVDYVGQEEYFRIRKRCAPDSGDVLISCSGTIGRIALCPENFPCVMVRSAALIKPKRSIVDSFFLQFFLQSNKGQDQIELRINQGAQPNLFLNRIVTIKTVLPPLPEQKRIARVLGDVDALIRKLETLIAKKRDIKQAAMQELLTGKRRLPGFSGPWETKKLGELGECLRGVSYKGDSDLSPYDLPCTIRLLRSNNIQNSRVNAIDVKFVNSKRVSNHQLMQTGDILICMANGSKELVGKAGYYYVIDGYEYTFGAFMGNFRTRPSKAISRFVYYLFQTGRYRDFINNLLAGSSINNLNPNTIESLEFPIPSLAEQTAIGAVLIDMDSELDKLEIRLAKTRDLKIALMQQLLVGKIRLGVA